ncbi:MAG TPA: DUF6600 domain-containing protein [Pyrinomonadaceae bacterium]|nr:DUF6600 domain-containing protein [Pyrinomonadaceae bacterium]
MKDIKVWPHLTIVAIICAMLGAGAVVLWKKHETRVQAEALPNAARIERVEGQVALNNSLSAAETDWVQAVPNTPVSVGDRIYTREGARTSLAFTGRNFATLDPNTSLDILALDDRRTQLALRDGNAIFDLGYLAPGDVFEVGTPYGAVDFEQPGLYQVGLDDNGGAIISVLSGLAQVVGMGGSGRVGKGEILTLLGQTAAEVVLSRLQPNDAGYFVDDYYRQRYPNQYDGRYSSYDAYLDDPYYYDPYRQFSSYQYASNSIPGLYDLDYYGDWVSLDDYGYSWRPRVETAWAPYQSGYWINDYPYGPAWVSSEPWGYAPYHYGRWINVGGQWYWVPDSANTNPFYSPALVAFVPMQSDMIGWVPLGPGDPYAPHYYDANWQPQYVYGSPVINQEVVNYYVPNAVTVVPVNQFGDVIDYRSVLKLDKQALAGSRLVYDPLTVGPLRNAFINSAWGRGKIDLPPGIAKRFMDRQVITSGIPASGVAHKDLAKVLRIQTVPDNARNENFKVRDDRQNFRSIGRKVHIAETDRRLEKGAQQELQRVEREQVRQSRRQEVEVRRSQERLAREQLQQQRDAARRQQVENVRRENEARRVANQQAATQRSQQLKQRQEQRQNPRQNQSQVKPPQRQRQVLMPMRQPERPQPVQKVERSEPKLGPPQRQQPQPQAQTQGQAQRKQQGPPAQQQQSAGNPGRGKGKGKP